MGSLLALDVGTVRIGVAFADGKVPIAVPLETVRVDGTEVERIITLAQSRAVERLIVGYPRNQSGEPTAQTAYVEEFVRKLGDTFPVSFQDESLTSVTAEKMLKESARSYEKADIDALAAALILQDYLETVSAA